MGEHTEPLTAVSGRNATPPTVTRHGAPHPPRDAYRAALSRTSLGASVDTLITVALIGLWGPLLVIAAVAALRAAADSRHRRHQHGRHHPQLRDRAQRTVGEIASRLATEASRPRRKITIIRRERKIPDPPLSPHPTRGPSRTVRDGCDGSGGGPPTRHTRHFLS